MAREGSCVILIDREGRLLLQQRDDDGPPEGYGRWTIPGGGREGGEDPRATALREFEEETGVRLERLRAWRSVTTRDYPGLRNEPLHLFFADDAVAEDQIEVREGLAFRYHAQEAIAGLKMNPPIRAILGDFLNTDYYRGTVEGQRPWKAGAVVIELDRWGRVLLGLRDADLPPDRFPSTWALPGGGLREGESPDSGALREFEEETGVLLEELKLFRLYRRATELPTLLVDVQHVYYTDADLELDELEVLEGEGWRYAAPDEIANLTMPPHHRAIVEQFFAGTAYRAMFH